MTMEPLRTVRAHQVLAIRELAARAQVAPSTVYEIELGMRTPRPSVMRRLAAALDVPPQHIQEFHAAIEAAKAPVFPRRLSASGR
jgi:transcriptional regulator with XRE-family HTH domain